MAAIARASRGPVTRESLADVEAYAGGDYLHDELVGPRDAAALARITEHVAVSMSTERDVTTREN